MKNYFSKIEDQISKLKNKNPFGAIISLIILIFLLLLYFTIPTFYNYENFDKEIQKKVLKDFKLNLKNISGITYLMVPAPHFLIEECDIYFEDNSEEKILKAKYLKINIFSKNLHKKEKIELKNIYLNKIDLDLQFIDLKNFYNHLKNNITKPIFLKNSNFFFRNDKDEIISISKIKNFEYYFNLQNNEKKLNILGNLFGSNFKFKWKKNFSNPYISISDIKFNKPKINILNKFNKKNENFTIASTNIELLKNNLDLNYKFNNNSIELLDDKSKKINHSKLVGKVELDPFFFDLNLILSGVRIQTVLNSLFLNLYNTSKTVDLNFNGNLKINLNEINNRLFENLVININFLDEKISLNNSSIKLKKIGKINFSDPSIYEKNQKIIINSKIKFDVVDQDELYRKFLISRQNRIDLNKVYFEVEYNIDEGNYFLSNINFDKNENNQKTFYEVKNIQQLNSIISKEFKKINLD
tara:strand:+ start:211 stop:1620 length:1410 start_codon:yes stop_codon:yes gene_type:complete